VRLDGSWDPYYHCRPCGFTVREDRVLELLRAVADRALTAELPELLETPQDDPVARLGRQIERQERLLQEAQNAMEKLLDAYEQGAIPLELLSRRVDERRNQIRNLERELAELRNQLTRHLASASPEEWIQELREFGHTMLDMIAQGSEDEQQQARRWLRDRFTVEAKSNQEIAVVLVPPWIC
jgi:chaperonin cofactor prefoldin